MTNTNTFGTVVGVIGFSFMVIGVYKQIVKLIQRQSAEDISLAEVSFRTMAGAMVLTQFITVGNPYLIACQSVFSAEMVVYWLTARHFQRRKK